LVTRVVKSKAMRCFANPEDVTLGFLTGGDQPSVAFLDEYNF